MYDGESREIEEVYATVSISIPLILFIGKVHNNKVSDREKVVRVVVVYVDLYVPYEYKPVHIRSQRIRGVKKFLFPSYNFSGWRRIEEYVRHFAGLLASPKWSWLASTKKLRARSAAHMKL